MYLNSSLDYLGRSMQILYKWLLQCISWGNNDKKTGPYVFSTHIFVINFGGFGCGCRIHRYGGPAVVTVKQKWKDSLLPTEACNWWSWDSRSLLSGLEGGVWGILMVRPSHLKLWCFQLIQKAQNQAMMREDGRMLEKQLVLRKHILKVIGIL